jgi:Fe-S-cluster containining protein
MDTVDYLGLRPEDAARLTIEERARFVLGATLRTAQVDGDCRCAALNGRVGAQVSCAVYERRPGACRQFQAGSKVCDYARQFVLGISLK